MSVITNTKITGVSNLSAQSNPTTGQTEIVGPDGETYSLKPADLNAAYRFEGGQLLFTLRNLEQATANFTVENQFDFPAPFNGIKVGFLNATETANTKISALSAAASPSADAAASSLSWIAGAYEGAPVSGTNMIELPPQGTAIETNYEVTFSDIIPVRSVERSDDSSKPYLLRVRTYAPAGSAGAPMIQVVPSEYAEWNSQFGTELRASSVNGEHTVDGAATGANTRHFTTYCVVPQYLCPVFNIALTGASTQDGYAGFPSTSVAPNSANWLFRACRALSGPEFVYSSYNFARSGTTFATSLQNAFNLLNSTDISFSAVIHRAGSGNSGWSAASVQEFRAGLISLYNACREKGVILIIDQVTPSYLAGATQERFMSQRKWVQDTFGSLPYARIHDSYAAVVDPADPAKLDAQYSIDPDNNNTHLNPAGWEKIAQDITIPLLRSFR